MDLPTPLALITPTHNPNVTHSVTGCHTPHCQAKHTCTNAPTHKHPHVGHLCPLPVLFLEGSRRPGKPSAHLRHCFSVCGARVFYQCSFRLCVWTGSSSQAELPRCPLGSLELWEAQRGSGKVATPHDLQFRPRGDWSVGLTVGVMSYLSANKTFDKCDGCCCV